jgi:ATP-binding protein involved in chromosome partitioning
MLAEQTHQSVAGVIENMSGFPCPHCGEPVDIFGVGGGTRVAEELSAGLGTSVPLMGRIPFDMRLREGGDRGEPLVLADPDAPASATLIDIAMRLGNKPRGLVGQSLGLSPAGR